METYDYVKKAHSDNVRTSCHIKKSNRVKLYGKVFKRQAPRGVLKSLPVVSIQSRFDRRFYTNLSGGVYSNSFILPIRVCAAGQGVVFDFSVIHRVYNFVRI